MRQRSSRVSNAFVGLLVGTTLGVAMSFLLMRFRLLNDMVSPLAVALNAIPIIVLVSVFNNQFASTSEVPRRLMVTLVVYFVVLVNVAKGLRQVEPTHLELLRSYAASPFAVLRKARVPNAVPFLFTALKIAAPLAVITAFVAEYFGGPQNGLGSRITSNVSGSRAAMWAYVIAAMLARPVVLPSLRCIGEPHHTSQGRQPQGRKHMKHKKLLGAGVVALALAAGLAAPAGASTGTTEPVGTLEAPSGECETVDAISLRLQWAIQAQFAGYIAARDTGIFDRYCLDVEIIETGVDIVPQADLADGNVDFALAWVPKALATREAGANIVNIAQIFQRSGTLQVSFADAGIASPEDFEGKNIGNWGFGNEYEIFAALAQAGLDPASDVSLVQQQFDMIGLLEGEIDAAEAMTYNEYAQVLEAENPDTGELYTPEDLSVISYEEIGVGMLQDAIWADAGRLEADPAYAGHRHAPRRRVDRRLGVLPGQPRGVPRPRRRRRLAARQQPPAVADERDQQADLAVARRASA